MASTAELARALAETKRELDKARSDLARERAKSSLYLRAGKSGARNARHKLKRQNKNLSMASLLQKLKAEKQSVEQQQDKLQAAAKQNDSNYTIHVYVALVIPTPFGAKSHFTDQTEGEQYTEVSKSRYSLTRVMKVKPSEFVVNALERQIVYNDVSLLAKRFPSLRTFDGYKTLDDAFARARTSRDWVSLIVSQVAVTHTVAADYSNFAHSNIMAYDDDECAKYISCAYNFKTGLGVGVDLVNNPKAYMKRSCWLNLIMDTYGEAFDAYYKKDSSKINHERLHAIFMSKSPKPRAFNKNGNNGYTFLEVRAFFEQYGLSCYVLNNHMEIVDKYTSETRNKKISPNTIYVCIHDDHAYRLEGEEKQLDQVRETISRLINDTTQKKLVEVKSARISEREREETVEMRLINSPSEIDAIIGDNKIVNGQSGCVDILYNNECCYELFDHIYKVHKIKAEIEMSASNRVLTGLKLNISKSKIIRVHTHKQEGVNQHQSFVDIDKYTHYVEQANWTKNQLLSSEFITEYSDSLTLMMNRAFPKPLVGNYLSSVHQKEYHMFDFVKFYSSIVRDMDTIPVCNAFDEFEEYNYSRKLQKYNVYYVEKLNKSANYPAQKYSLCYGKHLSRENKDYTIVSELKVSRLKKINGSAIVDKIFGDSTMSSLEKKNCLNHAVGMWGSRYKKAHKASLYKSKSECLASHHMYGGSWSHSEDGQWFMHYVCDQKEYENGFRLIQLLVYDTANYRLMELKRQCEEAELFVVRVNTDCVYLDARNDEVVAKFMQENDNLFGTEIGQLKCERKEIVNSGWLEDKSIKVEHKEPKIIFEPNTLKNERDITEAFHILDYSYAQITADIAGAGKSYLLKQYAVQKGLKAVFVVPTRELAQALKKDKVQAMTCAKFFGLRVFGQKLVQGSNMKRFDCSKTDMIVFDEIYMNDFPILQYMHRHMKDASNNKIRYYATGDINQLSPIIPNRDEYTFADLDAYRVRCIQKMFPESIHLLENKRCTSPEDQIKMRQLTDDIRKGVPIAEVAKKYGIKCIDKKIDTNSNTNLCGYHNTRSVVNDVVRKRLHPDGKMFVIGNYVRCCLRKEATKASPHTYDKNSLYKITNVGDKFIVLEDSYSEEATSEVMNVSIASMKKHFEMPYARTVHSTQGVSIEEPCTIFDVDTPIADTKWLYTAITRMTKLENITLCLKSLPLDDPTQLIKNRIASHRSVDTDAGRFWAEADYMTVEWALDVLKRTPNCQNNDCCVMLTCDDSENSFSFDRLDNNLAHTKQNLQLLCRNCNKSKKDL